jgi:hypothetical protein
METDALLRSILYGIMAAKKDGKGIDAAISVVRVMCSKDMIAAVEKELNEDRK